MVSCTGSCRIGRGDRRNNKTLKAVAVHSAERRRVRHRTPTTSWSSSSRAASHLLSLGRRCCVRGSSPPSPGPSPGRCAAWPSQDVGGNVIPGAPGAESPTCSSAGGAEGIHEHRDKGLAAPPANPVGSRHFGVDLSGEVPVAFPSSRPVPFSTSHCPWNFAH